ncbi:MAG: DUF4105 domain-containing protein [Candidatus Moraniibacteriota bacterium]
MIFFFSLLLLLGILLILFLSAQKPSNDRDWAPDVAILPSGHLSGDILTLKNIRAFRYGDDGSMMEKRFEKIFSIHDIRSVDLFIEPFSFVVGPAHSLLSFSLADGSRIVVSVEVRRQNHQRHASFWLSALGQYGLCYVIADEEDAILLRTNIRKDEVYLHPLRLTEEQCQNLFLDIMKRANTLLEHPELYSLLSNGCATNIRTHLNAVLDKQLPFHWSFLLPVFLPRYLYNRHLINTDLPFEEHRRSARINDKPDQYPDLSYSEAIRK